MIDLNTMNDFEADWALVNILTKPAWLRGGRQSDSQQPRIIKVLLSFRFSS